MFQDTDPNVLALAQQGHPGAISWLLNRDLANFGVSAQVMFRHGCLLVLIESDQVPPPGLMMSRIKHILNELGSLMINTVKVYGRERGQKAMAWMRELRMELYISDHLPAEAIAPLPQPIKQATAFLDAMAAPGPAAASASSAFSPGAAQTLPSKGLERGLEKGLAMTYPRQNKITQTPAKSMPRCLENEKPVKHSQRATLYGAWRSLWDGLQQTAIYWLVPERVRRRTVKQILHRQRRNQLVAILMASLIGIGIAIGLILVLDWLQSLGNSAL